MKTSIARPIERLADAVQEFCRRPEVRLMHVVVDEHLRGGALRILLAAEHLAANRSPWLTLELPGAAMDWKRLERSLDDEHRVRRGSGAPLAEIETQTAGAGAGRFAARLHQCGASVRPPASGLVVMLVCRAPRLESDGLEHLRKMIFDPSLAEVRLVMMTSPGPAVDEWSEALPPERCIRNRCVVDPDEAADELEREIEAQKQHGSAAAAPPGVQPPAPVTAGGAEDREMPELPVDPKAGPSATRSSGAGATPDDEDSDTIQICVKRAVLAMRRKNGAEAVRHQARARDLCLRDERFEDAVRMELVLGGMMLELRENGQAQASFARASSMAAEQQAHALEAQAHYAEAWTWREEREIDTALRSYWAGIDASKRADSPRLVFEGYWEAGCLLRPVDRANALVSLWTDAVSYANTIEPPRRLGTHLPQIVEGLVDVLNGMRRSADARAVEEWAEQAMEQSDAAPPSSP